MGAAAPPPPASTPDPSGLQPGTLLGAALLYVLWKYLDGALFGSAEEVAAPLTVLRTAGGLLAVLLFLRWRAGPGRFPPAPLPKPLPQASGPKPAPAWVRALAIYLAATPLLVFIGWLNVLLVGLFTGNPPVQEILRGYSALDTGERWATAALAVLLMPLLEELLFRGCLQRTFARRPEHGPRRALLFTSLVFAFAHGPVMWLPGFALGLLLGAFDLRFGDLRAPVAVHMAHNALVLVLTLVVAPMA